MCHFPTREPVCPPTVGKRKRAGGQALPGKNLEGRRKLLPTHQQGHESPALPWGSVIPRTPSPERGLALEAQGHRWLKRGLRLELPTASSPAREVFH